MFFTLHPNTHVYHHRRLNKFGVFSLIPSYLFKCAMTQGRDDQTKTDTNFVDLIYSRTPNKNGLHRNFKTDSSDEWIYLYIYLFDNV